jgi:nondiscriminating aspartyl-tRNA synthetase
VELAEYVGERVKIAGWLQSIRRRKTVTFFTVRDGWGTIQVVGAIGDVELESVIEVEGIVAGEPAIEVHASAVAIVSAAIAEPPVQLAKNLGNTTLPGLLEHAVVANRHPLRRSIFRLGAAAMRGFRAALDARGFVEIQTPKLVGGATEGGANVFAVSYFESTAYLAQSPQLYKQIMVGAFERVYEVGPVFRAEPHDTARHINQYTSLDVELGFIESHADVMAILVEVLREMLACVAACEGELRELDAALPVMPERVPALHFTEAVAMIASALGIEERTDLTPEGERWLGAWALREHASDFLFVTGYPLATRPFYTHPDPELPGSSRGFDLLFRGTELVTGGQRLHRYVDYEAALAARGMQAEPLHHYLQAFRHGMPPHGGFAIGLERWLMQLLGLPNIRLATLFPRDLTRLAP